MEKKILITSNACVNKFDNSLSAFQNEIPKNHLPAHKKWKLGVESIGISCHFLNQAVSKNNQHPALIFFSKGYLIEKLGFDNLASDSQNKLSLSARQPLNLDMFHPSQRYYLSKDKKYNLTSLNFHFESHTKLFKEQSNAYNPKFIGFPTSYRIVDGVEKLEFGQFGFSYQDEKLQAYLLFHETFYDHLNITDKRLLKSKNTANKEYSQVKVNDQIYYWGLFSLGSLDAMEITSIKAPFSIPKIIKIICPNVKPIMKNNAFCKEIAAITLSMEDVGTYLYKTVETLNNFELEDEDPDFLKIKLVDEFDSQLKLDSGTPTLIKAHLTSAEMNTINVKIDSDYNKLFPQNKNNKFSVKLAKKLQFLGKEPKICVSSVMFWNRLCYSSDLDLLYRIVDVNGINDFWIQNPIKDHDDIYEQFKYNVEPWIEVETTQLGNVKMKAKVKLIITLGKDMAYLLGWTNAPGNDYGTIELDTAETLISEFPRQKVPLFPNFIFLYSSCVKPSLVGDGLYKLLKIIPISENKSDGYKNIEFEHEEFLPLCNSEIEYIDFELRSHSGRLVEFVGTPQVYINLKFKDE